MNTLWIFFSEIIFPIKLRILREGHLLRFYTFQASAGSVVFATERVSAGSA